jgi:putative alpha-1,2-mannosidase
VKKVYSDLSPKNGYNGDEDQGLMGSLAVLMKIGLFQMNGGTEENPTYQIGSPIFDRIVISLNPAYYSEKEFIIKTLNNNPENVYVESGNWNGKPISNWELRHNELTKGGELVLEMSSKPKASY